ncbi:MAG: hypothetical protein K2X56_26645 [Mycobacterium pseudokansasii]|uniref:integrase catalytic domain-containing protein n=1 Tax=Mycobacterium pseudokansasii TaxID=2341080 RepID=UPI000C08B59A|nr:hypothetical protein [Mycobacterium pseudokansasii]MBY0391561.1 hypothetical protein [Mycobacterium pseudokansasii]VAZ93880.1 hypothetical protein LAUMK35_02451 [Mycobacterium pseudokansasii]VAZ94860.1 hypothetical protein LAUMK21_02452 [Mycobacterium pseudokansasii]
MLTGGRDPTLALALRRRNHVRHLRLWQKEGLRRRVHSHREWAGVSSAPEMVANAPKVLWAMDFQFDTTIEGKSVKIASLLDQHTDEALQRSITAERLIEGSAQAFAAAGGLPPLLRMDNGPELVCQALQES